MNGNGKLTYWLLGLLGTVVTGGTMAWLSNTNGSIRDHGERIAVMESRMDEQKRQLDRMNDKLDRIFERIIHIEKKGQ